MHTILEYIYNASNLLTHGIMSALRKSVVTVSIISYIWYDNNQQ